MPSKLDSALALARKGFRVFPLPVDDVNVPAKELKQPFMKNWPALATTDKKRIRAWWEEANYNIGIATGQGVIVLDYDMKEGQNGQRALDTHDMLGLPLDGMCATTATGGKHYIFRTETHLRNSASKVAKNVDVRGDGGYIVAPGSTIHGVAYISTRIRDVKELAPLPDWMEKLATAKRTNAADAGEDLGTDWDRPENIRRAIDYLTNEAPEAIEGHGGDETTYKVACALRDLKVSKQECLALLLEHWNDDKAAPPWNPEELEQKVTNAYKYATLPAGTSDALGEFGVVDVSLLETENETAETGSAPQQKLFFVDFNKAADEALTVLNKPLIDDLLDQGGLSAVYGRPGQHKTFNALNWAFHVATGKPWAGHETAPGLVVYVAAEGGGAVFKRLKALKQHHNVTERIPFALVPCPINLLDKTREGDTRSLIKLIRQAEALYGVKVALIVIDTLSRALAGGDENSSTDMGTFVKHIDKIRAATGAHLMVVAHSGKDQTKGLRGWSGILAALDTELEVHEGRITVTKQRDLEAIQPIPFVPKVVDLGTDARGRKVTSLIMDTSHEAIARAELELNKLSPLEEQLLDCLTELSEKKTTKDDKTPKLGNAEIQSFLTEKYGAERLHHSFKDKSNLRALLVKLKDSGALQNPERGQWVVT